MSAKTIFGFVILIIVAITCLYFVTKKQNVTELPPAKKVYIANCKESSTKTDQLGNVFTCIGGEWIFTGSDGDIKG